MIWCFCHKIEIIRAFFIRVDHPNVYIRTYVHVYTHRYTGTHAFLRMYIVSNPDSEFSSGGKVQNAAWYCSARPDRQIRIRY